MPTSVTISLPDDVKSFIEQRTQAGSYSSTSEFICQLVRADQKRAEQKQHPRLIQFSKLSHH